MKPILFIEMNTREQIIKAAWQLFSDRGFEDVSVRDVTNAAGVNLASVSYHFGSKAGLIQEIVKMTVNPGNKRRLELLDQFMKKYGGIEHVPDEKIVEAFVRPVIFPEEYGGNRDILARLAARYLIQRDYDIPAPVMLLFGEVFKAFGMALTPRFPHLSPEQVQERLLFCSGAALHMQSFGAIAGKTLGKEVEIEPQQLMEDLIDFCTAGFNQSNQTKTS